MGGSLVLSAEDKVLKILRKRVDGATITEISVLSKLSRSTVRVVLARFEGRGDVSYRNVGMAKVCRLVGVGE